MGMENERLEVIKGLQFKENGCEIAYYLRL